MQGRRVYEDWEFGQPGDYWKWRDDQWLVIVPTGLRGTINSRWTITEHEDGTITVAPSIQVTNDVPAQHWHGFLEKGIWREC